MALWVACQVAGLCVCPFPLGRVNCFHQTLKGAVNAKTLEPTALGHVGYASVGLVSITVFSSGVGIRTNSDSMRAEVQLGFSKQNPLIQSEHRT